ncbi:MAG TPA: DNA mismatch repair endonuclease MutL [Verrucomicrobiales bacterium]|nr:DNA mismatch repair endonuclease MutL [Verrucomicrobiales bacterium]
MPRVHVMPDALASQVAAGEVVERPASVVKELVENSLDAGAKELRVESQRGGVALVRVSDDGCGMDREDALLSLERHATSKLRDKEGLTAITTLGFRGEALPSIASVSRFRLTTCEHGAVAGTEIVVEGGKLRDVHEAGCPPGTTVEMRDLFYNLPARRKFLRREATEAAHIDYQVRLHALSCPGTRVTYRKEGRVAFDVAATSDRRVRIGDLTGRQNLGKLWEVPHLEHPGMAVSGYLLPPAEARKSRRGQYLFLNGRPVEDQVVWRALAEAYRGALVSGRHPGAWLWLEVDPLLVDVNVHPSKREVRFHRSAELRALILEAVEGTVRGGGKGFSGSLGRGGKQDLPIQNQESEVAGENSSIAESSFGSQQREEKADAGEQVGEGDPAVSGVEYSGVMASLRDERSFPSEPQTWRVEVQEELTREEEGSEVPPFRVLGVLEGRYLLLEASDGLVLLEGEAARERILFENFLEGAKQGTAESQGLLVPLLLELEPRDADVVLRNAENFRESGMEVEPFGGVTVQLRSVPVLLSSADPRSLLLDLVDELVHSAEGRSGRVLTFEKFAGELARVGARGERCRVESAQGLLDQLFACELPYCTPGGRPTLVQFSSSELRRKFGR